MITQSKAHAERSRSLEADKRSNAPTRSSVRSNADPTSAKATLVGTFDEELLSGRTHK
jgi:hypothetical protein